ncbi:phosphatidylinositol-3,5-bisphosphate 5-phosphatase [Phlyctochytrium planicorne]|nr:phosphatidylinositol-3,5-bisphosphate 5-phosphatase [Phlyctochytrium planicorne]
MVGSNQNEDNYCILKIDRTDPDELTITDDEVVYSKHEMMDLLAMIENGNKSSGGLSKVASCFGIVGFVKFLEGYYIILITKRSAVALIGGHYVYHIDDTLLVAITSPSSKIERKPEEARYIQAFNQVDLSKNFYFSYTYDITQSLQNNMTRAASGTEFQYNDMFVWNNYLLSSGFSNLNSKWALPVIYGYVDQFRIPVFGHNVFVTLIARRSRYFAGVRYLKRGVNDKGYVANDVETEQIVHDANTTSLIHPRGRVGEKPAFTSFLQHRGSIPLFWTQEASQLVPKPPIDINLIDPFFSAAALHFDNMFKRYGSPIIVLNLIKTKEKTPRESTLLDEFSQMIAYLNQFLHSDTKIRYIAWDMARASKSETQDVIGILEDLAEEILSTTGFFHSGPEPFINALRRATFLENGVEGNRILGRRQNGVVRTNCIDCLDRTNAAQFVIGKCALGHQLYALGVISHPSIPFDCDVANLLNAMYHDHGDTIALQYGGSHLVNTMETYHAEKQSSINLFLGNFEYKEGMPHLWEIQNDFYFHNSGPKHVSRIRSYTAWWSNHATLQGDNVYGNVRLEVDDYFNQYYRPKILTQFERLYAFNMNPGPSLNIGGVKRWLTLSASEKQTREKSMMRKESKEERLSLSKWDGSSPGALAPWWTTSALATRLLDPHVPLAELREYRRYVSQFRPSAIAFDPYTYGEPPAVVDAPPPYPVAATEVNPSERASTNSRPASVLGEPLPTIQEKTDTSTTATIPVAPPPPPMPTLSSPAPVPSTNLSIQRQHPDYDAFSSFIAKCHSDISFASSTRAMETSLDARDESLYSHYATQANKVSTYLGPVSRHDLPRYEAYGKWLATGKFQQQHGSSSQYMSRGGSRR